MREITVLSLDCTLGYRGCSSTAVLSSDCVHWDIGSVTSVAVLSLDCIHYDIGIDTLTGVQVFIP